MSLFVYKIDVAVTRECKSRSQSGWRILAQLHGRAPADWNAGGIIIEARCRSNCQEMESRGNLCSCGGFGNWMHAGKAGRKKNNDARA